MPFSVLNFTFLDLIADLQSVLMRNLEVISLVILFAHSIFQRERKVDIGNIDININNQC